ncbi:PilZ domain-containing protein [Halobacillus sp. BBL2006]|uniref:PilZ domain-containing protein n=1 Tax=Halobacillus sp. BBL2006 TaxID=1543706 RepID=UPI000541E465|nr:PilZ domain-containing protein [Halobacillus sp. BBL2006]KHE70762.1 hypothetical protein LD39_11155 [Halobacillus sp. BBL2006]
MRYRRHETLRYSFEEPNPAIFKIIKVGEKQVNSSSGPAQVVDISPGGMKLFTSVHIPLTSNVQVFVQTSIAHVDLSFTADVVWVKQARKGYHYGLDFIGDHQQEVVQALKKLRKTSTENST